MRIEGKRKKILQREDMLLVLISKRESLGLECGLVLEI